MGGSLWNMDDLISYGNSGAELGLLVLSICVTKEAQPYSHLELHPLSTQWSLASSMSLSCPGTGEPTTRPTRPSRSWRRPACILVASAQFFWTLAMTLPIYRSRLLYHILVGGTGGGVSEDKIQSIHALSPWMVRGLRWHLDVKNTLVAVC